MQYIDAAAVEAMAEPFTVLDVKCPLNFAAVITPAPSICPGPPARSIKDLAHGKLYLVPDDAEGGAEIAAHILCQAGFNVRIVGCGRGYLRPAGWLKPQANLVLWPPLLFGAAL